MADNQTITCYDATEAAAVLECFVRGMDSRGIDANRDAVGRVCIAMLRAILAPGETTSVVIVSGQGERG